MLYDPKWEIQADTAVVAILKAAREIVADKSRWTVGEYARSKHGYRCDPDHPRAVSFCSIGAIAKVCMKKVSVVEDGYPAAQFLRAAAKEAGYSNVPALNDRANHEAAVKMFDRAIELAAQV